jgi:hypothetical protein
MTLSAMLQQLDNICALLINGFHFNAKFQSLIMFRAIFCIQNHCYTERAAVAVMLLTRIRETVGLKIGWDTGCP